VGWLARVAISRQSFRLALIRNASLNERVMTRLGKFHCIPLGLLTDSAHLAVFSVNCHPKYDPRWFHSLLHLASSLPQATALWRWIYERQASLYLNERVILF
jgi:hypothetical protein